MYRVLQLSLYLILELQLGLLVTNELVHTRLVVQHAQRLPSQYSGAELQYSGEHLVWRLLPAVEEGDVAALPLHLREIHLISPVQFYTVEFTAQTRVVSSRTEAPRLLILHTSDGRIRETRGTQLKREIYIISL